MDKKTYLQIFDEVIEHYATCKRWKRKPLINECYGCWQINSILSNIRALGTINKNSTDIEFHHTISRLLNKMYYHNEQIRMKTKMTEPSIARPTVVRSK